MKLPLKSCSAKDISLSALLIACTLALGLLTSPSATAQSQPPRSDVRSMLKYLTKAKSQQGRNVCTVFALTAVLETLHMKSIGDVNFSEEWLQYLAASSRANASGGAAGSTVDTNFRQVRSYGMAEEEFMEYTAGKWTENSSEASKYCGELKGTELTRCLNGKRSPRYLRMSDNQLRDLPRGEQFIKARSNAEGNRSFTDNLQMRVLGNNRFGHRAEVETIKAYLNAGYTMTLELNLHFGSWNHPAGKKHGIDSNSTLYAKGIITYPERGSVDLALSPGIGARHAIQIIGYDDDIEVEYEKKMSDGTTQTFRRRGVYFIKNSWGSGFGSKFKFYGKYAAKGRGLGMITQDYANDLGKISVVTFRR